MRPYADIQTDRLKTALRERTPSLATKKTDEELERIAATAMARIDYINRVVARLTGKPSET